MRPIHLYLFSSNSVHTDNHIINFRFLPEIFLNENIAINYLPNLVPEILNSVK